VTTDLPLALAALLCIASFSRLVQEVTLARVVAAGAALSAALLVKLTALLLLPALLAMTLVAFVRRRPLPVRLPGGRSLELASRARRSVALAAALAATGLLVTAGIWAGYGFRYQAVQGPDAAQATMYPLALFGPPAPANMDEAWQLLLRDPRTGDARSGLVPGAVRIARRHRLLPEAYLFGMAAIGRHQAGRVTYLDGAISVGGRAAYFPLAFLWKTPIPTLILLVAGVAALAARRVRVGDLPLGVGLAAFAATYAAASLGRGPQHRAPPPAARVPGGLRGGGRRLGLGRDARRPGCGGRAGLRRRRLDRLGGAHFLGYFNEAAGGPLEGYRHLADSNVDWSQDLVRLREWMRREPGAPVALLQSGHAPWPRGLEVLPLLAREPGETVAPFGPGVYVVSAKRAGRPLQAVPARGELARSTAPAGLRGALARRPLRLEGGGGDLRCPASRPAGAAARRASRRRAHRHLVVRLPPLGGRAP
jgi:hypothetical protein